MSAERTLGGVGGGLLRDDEPLRDGVLLLDDSEPLHDDGVLLGGGGPLLDDGELLRDDEPLHDDGVLLGGDAPLHGGGSLRSHARDAQLPRGHGRAPRDHAHGHLRDVHAQNHDHCGRGHGHFHDDHAQIRDHGGHLPPHHDGHENGLHGHADDQEPPSCQAFLSRHACGDFSSPSSSCDEQPWIYGC